MRIQRLPSLLINQVAAGEVIERPASVVKELLENSLDAGATAIQIDIIEGGYGMIKITDNGCGIVKDDLTLALSNHTTSKICCLDDLMALTSLGFRGEALASIAAIAQVTLQSRSVDQDMAWQVHANGAEVGPIEPVAHVPGTTVIVQDLFFNTPVRKKFLRQAKTEFDHIETMVKRIALSQPDCAWQLTHQDKVILRLPKVVTEADQKRRIMRVFGRKFLAESVSVNRTAAGFRLWGWVGLPSLQRSQADLQYFYLNGRMIRDKVINHAIRQAYEALLYPGKQATYLLYLTLDPQAVDVNVHPTKHEVRFHEARMVHDFLVSTLQQVLAVPRKQPVLMEENSSYRVAETTAIYDVAERPSDQPQALGQIAQRYIIAATQDQLILCDYCALKQYLDSQDLLAQLAQGAITRRPLLVPVRIRMAVTEVQQRLQRLGWLVDMLDEHTAVIREFPTCLDQADIQATLTELLTQLANHADDTTLIATMARYNALPSILTKEEMNVLLSKAMKLKEHDFYRTLTTVELAELLL